MIAGHWRRPTTAKGSETTGHRVILLGLDGATLDLLGPWMDAGRLPHLRRMTQAGVWGELESTRPPTTAPAWVACVTGVNPGQHGVFDFRESPLLDPCRPLISSRSVQVPTLWQILSHHGKQVGLLNVPVSYPPQAVDGFVIGGMMSPGPLSNYTYPSDLRDELNAQGYVIDVEIQKYDVEAEADALRFLDDVEAALRKRAQVLFDLMDNRPWQFLMAVFIAADRIQHLFWKTMADQESRFYHAPHAQRLRERILTIYQAMDEMVGEVLARVDGDGHTDLFVVSDHGFGSTKAWINVNRWLEEQGWLQLKPAAALRKRLFYEAMKVNDSAVAKRLLPESWGRAVRGRVRGGRSAFKTDLDQCIDWTQTRAFFASIPSQGVYINLKRQGVGIVEPGAEYGALRQEIRDRLLALVDPRSGKRIVDRVWFREELYHGPQTHLAPDILFVAQDYAYLGRELLGTRGAVETSMNWANGFHRMNGLFLAYGPHVRSGVHLKGATMVDVAPTVLYDLKVPVPANVDGHVLVDALDAGHVAANAIRYEAASAQGERSVGQGYTDDEQAEVAGRLAGLGYIE
jgi:predicted AlkP superfamily phosphohydrolase/phosphomutase